jgi:hypothetical protein
MLISGHETEYILDFYKKRAYVPLADEDIAVYARAGGLRAGFELYRAFSRGRTPVQCVHDQKLPMPALALAGDKSNGMAELEMARELAENAMVVS